MTTEKCSPEDPLRCQGVTSNGQCAYRAVAGQKYCSYHSSGRAPRAYAKQKRERYMIDQQELRNSYNRQLDDQHYLDLTDEICLLQAMLERRLNTIKTDADLTMAVNSVSNLTQRLESMKINLMKLQQQLGLVLGKEQLRLLAASMATILDEELDGIEDKDSRMEAIVERLFQAIEEAGSRKES